MAAVMGAKLKRCFRSPVAKMQNGKVAYRGFVICMVLFCAYMQWSPIVDLDYVCLNSHEHYVGAAKPQQLGNVVMPTLPQLFSTHLEEVAPHLSPVPVEQFTMRLAPTPALRL
jgi:hypothetical protein